MDEGQSGEAEEAVQYAEVYFEYHEPTEETLQVKTEVVETSQKPAESALPPPENMEIDVPVVREYVPHVSEQVVSTTSTPEPDTAPLDTDIVTVPPDRESHSSGENTPFQSTTSPGEGAPFQSTTSPGQGAPFQSAGLRHSSPHAKLFEGDDTPLNAPVKELKEKWKLLPAFLQVDFPLLFA